MTEYATLAEMIDDAREQKMWLWCRYQDLWFSPDQLAAENANGRFRWGPINWRLRDPQERAQEAEERVAAAQREADRIRQAVTNA